MALSLALAGEPPPLRAMPIRADGEVVCRCGGAPAPIVPFAKVAVGDVLELASGAVVELLFYETGRRERWVGPATVTVGEDAGVGGAPEVLDHGAAVGAALRDLQVVVQRSELGRSASTLVRGEPGAVPELSDAERAELEAARARYAELRAAAPETDVLPELYLAAVLVTYGRDSEATGLLAQASARCGGCAAPKRFSAAIGE